MLSRTFAKCELDPFTGQYKKVGNQVLSVVRSAADENTLIFDYNGTVKSVRIKECSNEFIYQFRKKYINARGGATGLYEFLERALDGLYMTVFNKVFEYMS